MHKTARCVRFSINPFLPSDNEGFNSFASKPTGEGLSLFFELLVEVAGEVEPATGFVVNVVDIDKSVRKFVVPIFARRIREDFRQGRHIGFFEIAELLRAAWGRLEKRLTAENAEFAEKEIKIKNSAVSASSAVKEKGMVRLSKLSLKLNPFRKVEIDSGDSKMIYFSEKFEFAATHKLWNEQFSDERNFEVFGDCANPTGHGHNYIVEVTIKKPAGGSSFCVGDFEKIVDDELMKLIDHKNLNTDVAEFGKTNPTVENIAVFAWKKLAGKFSEAKLHCITVWETDKTYCSYYGE